MDEADWLSSINPEPMLAFLHGKASDRKLRLFGVACCRGVWGMLTAARSRVAVEVVERYADGLATAEELSQAYAGAVRTSANVRQYNRKTRETGTAHRGNREAINAATLAVIDLPYPRPMQDNGALLARLTAWAKTAAADANESAAPLWQVALLRCIFGNPFCLVQVEPAWRSPDVLRLAEAAYDERSLPSGHLDNTNLAVLADALEEMGSPGPLLEHLRSPGPHVRGCHALDAVLGKE
jgi:hypothetical protein